MKKCTCMTAYDYANCNQQCDADTKPEARHPSEITLEEFIEVARIMNPATFSGRHQWTILNTETEGVENAIRLKSDTSSHHFHIDWDDDLDIDFFDGVYEELQNPTFQQSIKIAAYLDQIGIEYRPK